MKTKNDNIIANSIDDFKIDLSIIPTGSNKVPFKEWDIYKTTIAPITYWHSHYLNQGTVGVICGKISGNLECIDIDIKNDPRKTIVQEFNNLISLELVNKLLVQSTPSGGLHYIYRCPEAIIEKNQKLAKHTNGEVILETRGEGGYFCTNKINNKVLHGKFNLETLEIEIPIITPEERLFLLESARSLTRYFPSGNTKSKNAAFVYSEPAINEFNNKYNCLDLFTKHNWSIVDEDDEKYFLLRNGSLATHSGYYFKATKTFFCFSTSTEFKPEKPYNNFQILQVFEGKNDYKTTLRLLSDYGFEVKDKSNTTSNKISPDDIAAYLNGIGVRYDSFIQDLTLNGQIIEEMDYNTVYINLKKHFEKEISRPRFEETIKSHYITTINPVLDFIEANKHRNPLGTFEKWLGCMVLKNKSIDESIVLLFLKKWYVGMIAQALDGKYPNEYFLTLLSVEQGIGKTSFLRNNVLPLELYAYRKEHSLSFDDDFKIMMSQAMLIVDDEMDGRTYEADKTFKTVLSTKELTMRRKYDRRISTIKRRCSFAGSGNNLAVVREEQNRRIIPIEIESFHFEKLAEIDYSDLFMEAYNLYTNGFQYSYQKNDMKYLKHLYNDYIQKSDVELILDEFIQPAETIGDTFFITNLDIVTTLTFKYPYFARRINVPTIGKLMNERGYETIRKGKKGITCYVISKTSVIINFLESTTQSISLNYRDWVG
jgi:hypothetical protein